MKFIELGAETIALILAPPLFRPHPKVTVSFPFIDIQTAISHRESRNNFGRSSRYAFEYTARFGTVALANEFRTGLTRLKNEQVAVPLWMDFVKCPNPFNAGATVITKTSLNPVRSGAEWIILNPATQVYEIVTVTSFDSTTITLSAATTLNWPANTLIYPLMFGRFQERPRIRAIKPEKAIAPLKFVEDSPFARTLRMTAGTMATVGSNITELASYRLWNIEPTFAELLDTTEVDIIYQALGFLRQDQQYVYSQFNRRGLELAFAGRTRDQIGQIERIFFDRLGPKKPLCIPTFVANMKLAAALPIAGQDHRITIEPNEYSDADRPPQPGDPFLALLGPFNPATGLTPIEPRRVTDVFGGILTIDPATPAITVAHSIADTRVSHLLLAHLSEAQIVWDYSAPGRASTRLKFVEAPDEYFDPPADLPEPLFLYRITEKLDEPIVSLFTNYENTLLVGGDWWTSSPFEHGPITRSLTPGNTKTELTSWSGNFPGNPLGKLIPRTLNAELVLEILLGDANDLLAPLETLFFGDIMGVSQSGPDLTASCVWGGRAFKRDLLRHRVRRNDNNVMFSPASGIDKDTFKVTGRVSVLDDTPIIQVTHLEPGGQVEDWFAGGWLETGTGDDKEIRSIMHSEELSGDQVLTLDRPLEHAVTDQDVDLYPGYDSSLEMWLAKFAGGDPGGFGGYAFVPDTNPEIKAMEAVQAQGGKK